MQTIEIYDLVSPPFSTPFSAAFEACAVFEAGTDGAPICSGCGWLASEHDRPVAQVGALPRRQPIRVTPKRLAS